MHIAIAALTAWVVAGVVTDACYGRALARHPRLAARHRATSEIVPAWVVHLAVKLYWPVAAWSLATGHWKKEDGHAGDQRP